MAGGAPTSNNWSPKEGENELASTSFVASKEQVTIIHTLPVSPLRDETRRLSQGRSLLIPALGEHTSNLWNRPGIAGDSIP